MTTVIAASAVRVRHLAHRCVVPLLILETLGLLGLLTSWRVAAIAAAITALAIGVVSSLRHASNQIDAILQDELDDRRETST